MMTMMILRTILTAALLLAVPAIAAAAPQPPAPQEEFVPVDELGDPQEQIPATPLVAAAYGVAWLAVLIYVWSVWRRLDRVDRELGEVTRRLGSRLEP